MKITVCEFPDEAPRKEAAWKDLVRFLHTSPTEVVVLPEMPFCDWQMFRTRTIDPAAWQAALTVHDVMLARPARGGGADRRVSTVYGIVIHRTSTRTWSGRRPPHCGTTGDHWAPAVAHGRVHGGRHVRVLCRLRESPVL
jgi:hypothetical protein